MIMGLALHCLSLAKPFLPAFRGPEVRRLTQTADKFAFNCPVHVQFPF